MEVIVAENKVFKHQLGLATRAQLLKQNVTPEQIRAALAQGRWAREAPGLYAIASSPASPARRLLAVCLLTGGVASHASAAWLWGLLRHEPSSHDVSVPFERRPTVPAGPGRRSKVASQTIRPEWPPIAVHRSRDLSIRSLTTRQGIPTTNPLRTLVDLAGVVSPALLDEATDAAVAVRLVTVDGLMAEASRLRRPGRRGPAQLTDRLKQRGFVGAPAPSVLESRALRLLTSAGIKVENCETVVAEGRYRLDVQLEGRLFVELDGYAYHWSPEHKSHDDARRNKLRLLGSEILVYDWQTVTKAPRRFVREVKEALTNHK